MKSDSKPVTVALKGQTVASPPQPMVKITDELDEADLDLVAGGAPYVPTYPSYTQVEKVKLPASGIGSFHFGAWAV